MVIEDDNLIDPIIEALNATIKDAPQLKAARDKFALPKPAKLEPEAPAPNLSHMITERGSEPTREALEAWQARSGGAPIVDIAHDMGLSIESAKALIKEAHAAITEDLKANLDLNRQLDLSRIDSLISSYLPSAKAGEHASANVIIKCLQQRAKLTGLEPMDVPGRSHPENVLVWVQAQLPSINRIVDSLPLDQ
jgi:hypothetical protein